MRNLKIIKNMGVIWTFNRFIYELKKRTGILKRKFNPQQLDNDQFIRKKLNINIQSEVDFYLYLRETMSLFSYTPLDVNQLKKSLENILKNEKREVINFADKIVENNFQYFSKSWWKYNSVDWHYSPFTMKSSPKEKHWLDISDLNSDFGDIKFIWELSRFTFVYDLARAYVLTSDDKYAEKYWELIEDWIESNPSEKGVNYKCGQEMSIRVMSWIFGLHIFIDHSSSTSTRVTSLLKTIYMHIDHVEKNFEFALKSVRNNHTITEAAGMYTVGVLFPFFEHSDKWREKGKKYLEKEVMWQIYKDGSYIQNSMNYHRLMLQNYTWVLRLAEINGDTFSKRLKNRLKKAVLFLYQNQNLSDGRVPNYGANDGALIHPLSTNDYLDYRPQLNAAWMVLTTERLYINGTYDESILWLFGENSLQKKMTQIKQVSMKYIKGGYYTFRNKNNYGMVRCIAYKNRPAQADMLHFDLWINGKNMLTDAGSYSYNTKEDYLNYFRGTAAHNTVMIGQNDQMEKGSRFLWYDWTKSKTIKYNANENYTIFEGEHYGYTPFTHRRGIINMKSDWIITDDIFGNFRNKGEKISLSWLFGIDDLNENDLNEWIVDIKGEKYKVKIFGPQNTKTNVYKGNKDPFRGWQSLYYGLKQEVPQILLTSIQNKPTRFITVITKYESSIIYDGNKVVINKREVELEGIGKRNIFKKIN